MTTFDWILVGLIAASTLLALWRGVVHEVLSLASWIGAFWVARQYAADFEPMLPQSVPTADLRWLLAFAAVMVGVWIVLAIGRRLASRLVSGVGLGGLDRTLGGAFGLARGVLLSTVVVMLGGLTHMPSEPFWQNALLVTPFERLAVDLKPWLPADMADRINFQRDGNSGGEALPLPIRNSIKT